MSLFKKSPSRAEREEAQRRWAIIKEKVYPLLLTKCSSVNEMKQRLESTGQAIQNEMVIKVSDYKKLLEGEKLSGWNVKPLKGKGVDIEQKILDILADEEMKVVDMILGNLPRILDTFIYEEMGKRKPDSLEVRFP